MDKRKCQEKRKSEHGAGNELQENDKAAASRKQALENEADEWTTKSRRLKGYREVENKAKRCKTEATSTEKGMEMETDTTTSTEEPKAKKEKPKLLTEDETKKATTTMRDTKW